MRDDDMTKILTLAGGAALKVPPPPPTPKAIAVLLNPRKLNSVLVLRIPSLRNKCTDFQRKICPWLIYVKKGLVSCKK